MNNENIIIEPIRFNYEDTEMMYLDKNGDYTVDDFIALLEQAKNRWGGDKKIHLVGSYNGFSKSLSDLILEDESTVCIPV